MTTIRLSAFSDEAADSIDGQIAALKRNNIAYTELRSVDGKNVSEFTDKEAAEYVCKLHGEGINVWAVGSPLGKTDISTDFSEYEKKVRRVCATAKILGTDKVRIFSFFNAYGKRKEVIERLRHMTEIGYEYGITMYHENEKEIYGDTAERVLDLMDHVPNLRFIYDPANFLQTGECANNTLPLLHRCGYVHIKDARLGGAIVPAGMGDGQIERLLGELKGEVTLTLEPHLALFSAYKNIDGTELKNELTFSDNDSAFDAAATALKELLRKTGFCATGVTGEFVKK